MSETTTTTPAPSPAAVQQVAVLPPLVSSSPANQSTAAASSGGAAGIVIIILWILGLFKIPVPPEVAAAFVVVIGSIVHGVMIKFGFPVTTETTTTTPSGNVAAITTK